MLLPDHFLNSLNGIAGFEKSAFEAVHQSKKQITSIRINPLKSIVALSKLNLSPVPWCKYGHYLLERPSFTFDPYFHAGAYYVQEASSMFLWQILEQVIGTNTKDKIVLDLCAAPGGKSTLLQSYFTDGLIVSNEVIKSRAAILVENCTKWGLTNTIITNNDPDHFARLPNYFDVIVVDAPCSGSGLFRKDPAAIGEWSSENVLHCSMRQESILSSILPSLKENGIFIYSTCSYSLQENEQIVDWMEHELKLEAIELSILPEWHIIKTQSKGAKAPCYRFYPYLLEGEGFFIAAFKKTAQTAHLKYRETSLTKPSREELVAFQSFYPIPVGFTCFKQNNAIRVVPEIYFKVLQQLAAVLYIKKAGVELGTLKSKGCIPSHELAVAVFEKENLPSIELTKEEAILYLKRDTLNVEGPKGWCLVKYEGNYLGWVKKLPNRMNNYYPAEWRILKE